MRFLLHVYEQISTEALALRATFSGCGWYVLIELHQILHVILATEEYGASVVNSCRYDIEDTLCPRRGYTTSLYNDSHCKQVRSYEVLINSYLFDQKCHRERLIQQPQLPALAFLVIRIPKDPTIQQRPMNVGNHRPNVSCAVR